MNRKIENLTKGTGAVLPAWYWSNCTLDGWIWKSDELSRDGDKFLLSVVFRQGMETKTYRIRFRDCVVRKNGDGTAPD